MKLLFSVPARHDAAFADYLRAAHLPSDSHPLLHRGKSAFFVPDAAVIARFDMSVRVCGVGEFVLLDNNVWHAGVNLGANCSISVNVLGAGGIDALQRDLAAIVDDMHDMRQRMIDFDRQWTDGKLRLSEAVVKDKWNSAAKLIQKQITIYNSATDTHTHTHTHTHTNTRNQIHR